LGHDADIVDKSEARPLRSAAYLAVKRAEAAEFARHDVAFECSRHFIVF
jgi:hypothetical protein